MRETTTVAFKISSPTLSAKDIAARIGGLAPDNSWAAGTARGAFGAVEKQHGFVLESKLGNFDPIEDHVKAMVKRLAPYAAKIGELAALATVEFSCSIARKRGPALHFERDDLRWLAAMGARLDIDVSILVEPPKPPAKAPGAP